MNATTATASTGASAQAAIPAAHSAIPPRYRRRPRSGFSPRAASSEPAKMPMLIAVVTIA